MCHYRVIDPNIQRSQVTFFSSMNLTVLSDPGPGYVLPDKLNRTRAFSLSLSSQAKPYLHNYIFLASEIASTCQLGLIPGPC